MKKKYWTACIDVVALKRSVKQHDRVCENDLPDSRLATKADVQTCVRELLGDLAVEAVVAIYTDTNHRVIGAARLCVGIPGQAVIHPRTVFTAGLLSGAAAVVLAHNHPGGTMVASEADWRLVGRLREVGDALDMPLLDSLILSDDRIVSMRESARW